MLKLYGLEVSGNVYKVKLLLSLLGLEHEDIRVNLLEGEHKQPAFLALNPFSQIPVLTDGDLAFSDAQSILVYLARKYGNGTENQWLRRHCCFSVHCAGTRWQDFARALSTRSRLD